MLLQMAEFRSSLWLSNIPVCVRVRVCVYNIFFIHSSVEGNLGCFHILALINIAAMNIGVHVCFQISIFFSSDIYPGVGLLDHMVVLLFFFSTLFFFSFK